MYCPAGTGPRAVTVPKNYYSIPADEFYSNNREAIVKCPRLSNCLDGIEYPGLLWIGGECAAYAEADGENSRAYVYVNEGVAGVPVGAGQSILSPYPVDFTFNGDGNGAFFMEVTGNNTANVMVNTTHALDYETRSTYQVSISALSNGTSINCTMNIYVVDVNEKPELDFGEPPFRNVSEAAIVNSYLPGPPMKANDPDAGDEHIFGLVASDPPEGMNIFGIGGCSGRVYVADNTGLDVVATPRYNLTVHVRDDASDSLSDTGNLTVYVLNANDPPYFVNTEDQIRCEVSEGNRANDTLTGANCTGGFKWGDPDTPFGDTVVFTISRKDVDNTFGIKPDTGELYVKRNGDIDYEFRTKYSIEITITDLEGLSASMDLTILVSNVNEAPVTEYPLAFVDENTAPGTTVVAASRVITTDPDGVRFRYSLLKDGNSTDGNGTLYFNISADDGSIVVGPAVLNYEKVSSHILTVITQDFGIDDCGTTCPDDHLSSQTRVSITIQNLNELPTLKMSEEYWIPEDAAAGTNLGYVYTRDEDLGQSHSYSLSGTDGVLFSVAPFGSKRALVALNGAQDDGTNGLNFEENPGPLSIQVTVSDGALSSTRNLTVYVNNSNDAPVCPGTLALGIDENLVGPLYPLVGGQVSTDAVQMSFNYTDEDDPAVLPSRWGLASLGVSLQEEGVVSVTAQCLSPSCESREANLTLNIPLDYERTPTATFLVTVTDGGGLSCETFATINVGNVNEPPTFPASQRNQTVFISDAATVGSSAGFVTAEDPDAETNLFGTLTYSLFYAAGGLTQCEPDPSFEVDVYRTLSISSSTGQLRILNASSAAIKALRSFCVGVRVEDGGGLVAETSVNVNVADANFAPIFADRTIYVAEHTPSWTNLTLLVADDDDPGADGVRFSLQNCKAGPNATLSCVDRDDMFVLTGTRSPVESWFKLGESELNYEDPVFEGLLPPTFVLTLKMTDSYDPVPMSGFGELRVVVTDEPDSPTFSDSAYAVDEAQDAGVLVGDLSTHAADEDAGSSITFALDRSLTFPDALTWEACWSRCVDAGLQMACVDSAAKQAEVLAAYGTAAAADDDAPAFVWLGLKDRDRDGAFEWDPTPGCDAGQAGYESWGAAQPAAGAYCALMDAASGDWASAKCSATPAVGPAMCACEPGPFSVSSAGVVTTAGTLNYEMIASYALPVVATDNTGLAAAATATITVEDVEEPPVVEAGQRFSVAESASRGATVGRVEASDDDAGDSATFELLNGTAYFTLTPDDGDILVGGDVAGAFIDFECQTSYVLSVSATDTTGLVTVALVVVDVADVNDVTVDAISTAATVAMPASDGALFAASADLGCVCEAQGLFYDGGASTTGPATLCRLNYGTAGACGAGPTAVSCGSKQVVTSVECTNPAALPTLGGSEDNGLVVLTGTNFGPCGGPQGGAVVVTATYTNGLDGLVYEAAGCAVQPGANTEIRCAAAPGVGTGHTWNVTVDSSAAHFTGGDAPGGPWSAESAATTSYRAPALVNVTGAALMDTGGGAEVVLTGRDLPPLCLRLARGLRRRRAPAGAERSRRGRGLSVPGRGRAGRGRGPRQLGHLPVPQPARPGARQGRGLHLARRRRGGALVAGHGGRGGRGRGGPHGGPLAVPRHGLRGAPDRHPRGELRRRLRRAGAARHL